jgi:hypothetical protein
MLRLAIRAVMGKQWVFDEALQETTAIADMESMKFATFLIVFMV